MVSWSPPLKPNGYPDGYTVYHRPQLQSNANVQINRVSASEHSLIIESDFQGNVTYEVWVKARNRRQESMSSRLVQLTFDGTSNIDQISGLAMMNMTETGMQLGWKKVPKAEGYIVQLVLPHPYPRIEPIKTKETSVKIDNLVNGAQYVARVCAYVGNYTGRSQSLILKRNGTPLPEVQGIETKREGDFIRLTWRRATPLKGEKLTYGIYYGIALDDLFDLPKHTTQETNYLLKELHECQSYLIAVGIVGPNGPGPLGKNPRAIETPYSHKKPPKNLAVSFDETKQTMDISWEHSCSLSNKDYPDYIVSLQRMIIGGMKKINTSLLLFVCFQVNIREVILNKLSTVKVPSKNNSSSLIHTFHEVPRGAKYEISVMTTLFGSAPANITASSHPLPAPRLMSVYPEKNGSYVVMWKEVRDVQEK